MYTTDCNYFKVTNYNTVQQGYYAWTGCTGIVSVTPIDPLDSHFVCAYDLYAQDCGAPLNVVFVGICNLITPTPTITPTTTPTITPTPTFTPTPSITQTFIPVYNLWSAGYFEDACGEAGYGPSNIAIYSAIPFEALQPGDYVYGNQSLTIPPVFIGNIVSDGAVWVQFDINNGLVIDTGICF